MAYGTVNADVIGTSVAGSNLGAGNASIMKNRIINGAMVINQRAWSGTITSDSTYTLDRWCARNDLTSKMSISQSSDAPAGFSNSLLVTSLSAYSVPAGGYYFVVQSVEGFNSSDLAWGTANAKTVTVSFWVKSSLTGTFGGSIVNSAETRCYPFSYTISSANTWEQKSITIAGDTTGTWVGSTNGVGLRLSLEVGIGTSLSSAAGAWTGTSSQYGATGATNVLGTNGATIQWTGVQLEVGSSATGFEYVNYQTSLANCQRYFTAFTTTADGAPIGAGRFYSSTAARGVIAFPVPMRTAPSVSANAVGNFALGSINTCNALSFAVPTTNFVKFDAATASSSTTGYAALLEFTGTSGIISASAEL